MSNLLICVDCKDFPVQIPHVFYLPSSSPVVLCGSTGMLNLQRTTIFNSRQTPRLNRNQPWIRKTLEVLHHLDPRDTAVVSSLGTPAWDFLTWAAGKMGFPLILVFPAGSAQNFNVLRTKTIMDFGLDEPKVLALRPIRLGSKKPSAEDNTIRDRWVAALSRHLMPVCLRMGGNLDRLLGHDSLPKEAVVRDFQIPGEPVSPVKKPIDVGSISVPEWYQPDKYLIHWTRSCVGPYPAESRVEYFSRIMEGPEEEIDGAQTLNRILQEGVIRASTHLVRGAYPIVSFTERPPQELPRLIHWRSGLRRWTFEPFGMALSKERLSAQGARPVIYADVAKYHELTETDRPFFQVERSAGYDWTKEREWRVLGDVWLDQFSDAESLILKPIVRTPL
jgi:hypothetical protein